jgi:hypothetical protein
MGAAADRKLNEIDQERERLGADLEELQQRMPRGIPSVGRTAIALLGSSIGATVLAVIRARRRSRPPSAEVVVRIVREDA